MSINRQASNASGDFASQASSSRSDVLLKKKAHAGDADGELGETKAAEATIFAVAHVMMKESFESSWKFVVAVMVVDFLQLLMLLLRPEYGWHINRNVWIWKGVHSVNLGFLFTSRGYSFYISVLYLLLALLGLAIGMCTWIGWCLRKDTLTLKWPTSVARLLLAACCTVTFVGLLDALFVSIDCRPFSSNDTVHMHLTSFPNQGCLAMPHAIHAAVALVQLVILVLMACIMCIAGTATNPLTTRKLGSQHCVVALRTLVCRVIIVAAGRLLIDNTKLQSAALLLCHLYMLWSMLAWAPLLHEWVNHARVAADAGLTWVALMLVVMRHGGRHPQDPSWTHHITDLALEGLAPIMVGFAAASYLWQRYKTHKIMKAFRQPDVHAMKLKSVYKFEDVYEVELAARCCRKWVDDDVLDQDAVQLAEFIIRVGMARFPTSAFLTIISANFLNDVQQNHQSAQRRLDAARKMPGGSSLPLRYIFFAREQEHTSRSRDGDGSEGSGLDLGGHVEFQRVLRKVLYSHKSAAQASKAFWKMLLHHDIKFTDLMSSFDEIEKLESKADHMYCTMLERYPASAKLLKCYSRFLEDVKSDPAVAARYLSHAERLEEPSSAPQQDCAGNVGSSAENMNITANSHAVVLIDASGTIQMANKKLTDMFGYKKGMLDGHNVSLLMPKPFSTLHDGFLRNYIQTGKAMVVDRTRDVLAMHNTGQIFPCRLYVSVVSGAGSDAMFLGALQAIKPDPSMVRLWMLRDGIVLAIDQTFTTWFGKLQRDCLGRHFTSLGVDPQHTNSVLEMAAAATMEQLAAGAVQAHGVAMQHAYLDSIKVDVRVRAVGTENQPILQMEMLKSTENDRDHVLVTDDKLNIVFATDGAARMLGYSPEQMVGTLNISNLMNPPFSLLHEQWVQDMPAKIPTNSCRNGVTVVAVTSSGTPMPVRVMIEPRVVAETSVYLVRIKKSNFEEGLDFRRLSLHISADGTVEQVNSAPFALFGFKPAAALGKRISALIDVLGELVDMECLDLGTILTAMAARETQHPGHTWRVGVHQPFDKVLQAVQGEQHAELHKALRTQQTRSSMMQLQLVGTEGEGAVCDEFEPKQMVLHLYRADAMTGIVETDKVGRIIKAGCCPLHMPGPLFGCTSSSMQRQRLQDYVGGLPGDGIARSILDWGKTKGALKGSAAASTRLGPLKKVIATHSDGRPLQLKLQGCAKDITGHRMMLRMELADRVVGQVDAFKSSIGLQPSAAAQAADGRQDARPQRAGSELAAVELQPHSVKQLADDAAVDDDALEYEDMAGKPKQESNNQQLKIAAAVLPPDQQPEQPAGNAKLDEVLSVVSASNTDGDDALEDHQDTSQVNFSRSRRNKQILRLLQRGKTQTAMAGLRRNVYAILAGLLLAHTVCFAIMAPMIKNLNQYANEVDACGQAVAMLNKVSLSCMVLRQLHQGVDAPGVYTQADMGTYHELLGTQLESFQYLHHGLFLGFNKLRHLYSDRHPNNLQDVWQTQAFAAPTMVDRSIQPYFKNVNMSLFTLGNKFIASAVEIYYNHNRIAGSAVGSRNSTDLATSRHWQFIVRATDTLYNTYASAMNGFVERAMGQVLLVGDFNRVLLVVEGCSVCLVAVMLALLVLQHIARLRHQMVLVFLMVPAGFLRAVAFKHIQIDEDDLNDSDDDDEPPPPPLPAGPTAGTAGQAGYQQATSAAALDSGALPGWSGSASQQPAGAGCIKHRIVSCVMTAFMTTSPSIGLPGRRRLKPGNGATIAVLAPFLLWAAVVVGVNAWSYASLTAMIAPLGTTNLVNRVQFRVIREVLVSFAYSNGIHPAAYNKTAINRITPKLAAAYSALMLGAPPFADSKWATSGIAFHDRKSMQPFFYAKGHCFRTDPSTCLNATHKFYEVSHNGMELMMLRLVEEGALLARDNSSWVNATSPRIQYIWQVGNNDLYEGLRHTTEVNIHTTQTNFQSVLSVHVILFTLSWALALMFLICVFWPFLGLLQRQLKRTAMLLGQLPTDVDVQSLLKQALELGG